MDPEKKQLVLIRLCANAGKSSKEMRTVIRQVLKEESMSHTQVSERQAQFRACRTSLEEDRHTGRPFTFSVPDIEAKLQQLLREDACRTNQNVLTRSELVMGQTCQAILTAELSVRRVDTKSLPRILT
jgi:hypothetical protein